MRTALSLTVTALACLALAAPAADDDKEIDPYDQSGVPLEKQPDDEHKQEPQAREPLRHHAPRNSNASAKRRRIPPLL